MELAQPACLDIKCHLLLLVLLQNLAEDVPISKKLALLVGYELLREKTAWSAAVLYLAICERLSNYRPLPPVKLERHACLVQRLYKLILLEKWLIDEGIEVLAFEPSVGNRRYQTGYHEHFLRIFALKDTWLSKRSLIRDDLADISDLLYKLA